jgi:hypothetical protein
MSLHPPSRQDYCESSIVIPDSATIRPFMQLTKTASAVLSQPRTIASSPATDSQSLCFTVDAVGTLLSSTFPVRSRWATLPNYWWARQS